MQTPKNLFKGKTSFFTFEGVLKALLCGLSVGFAAVFAVAAVVWFKGDLNLLFLMPVIGGAAFLLFTPFFYAACFKPKEKVMAARLDRTGLEERMITMLQYQNDDSFMAQMQRQDAMEKVTSEATERVPYYHVARFVSTCVTFALMATAMTTVSILSVNGVIPGGDEFTNNVIEDYFESYLSVSYLVEGDEGGMIEGDPEQLIKYGGSATGILAVEDEGYVFQYWAEDGSEDPYREDANIRDDQVWTAVFAPVGDGEEGEGGGGDGEDDKPQDPQDQPQQSNSSNGSSNSSDSQEEPPESNNGSGGSLVDHNNYILDGETYYRDEYDQDYYDKLMNELANNRELTAEERAFIELYLSTIK